MYACTTIASGHRLGARAKVRSPRTHERDGPFPVAAGARAGRIYNWPTRRFVDTTRDLSFVSYARALRIADIRSAPTFLKMDIEGYECVRAHPSAVRPATLIHSLDFHPALWQMGGPAAAGRQPHDGASPSCRRGALSDPDAGTAMVWKTQEPGGAARPRSAPSQRRLRYRPAQRQP